MGTRPTMSNGKEIDLYSTRYIHILLIFKNQSKELSGFQNGEAFSAQRTNARTTLAGDFHGNPNFYDSEDETGQIVLNANPDSSTNEIMNALWTYQNSPQPRRDTFFSMKITNDLTGELINAEGIRIQNLPANQGNESAFSLAWTLLCGFYEDVFPAPDDSLFQNLTD